MAWHIRSPRDTIAKQSTSRRPPWTRTSRRAAPCCVQRSIPDGADAADVRVERGVRFRVGTAFFREEAVQGRDLAMLAAALHREDLQLSAGDEDNVQLRVLDATAGTGVRGCRYFEAGAAEVCANDIEPSVPAAENLASAVGNGIPGSRKCDHLFCFCIFYVPAFYMHLYFTAILDAFLSYILIIAINKMQVSFVNYRWKRFCMRIMYIVLICRYIISFHHSTT